MTKPHGPRIGDAGDPAAPEAEAGEPQEDAPREAGTPEAEAGEPQEDAPREAGPMETDPQGPTLEEQLEEARDRYLRLAAELENFKRRALRERQELLSYAHENLVKELLPTVDNLERALQHAQGSEGGNDSEKILEGIQLTYRSLLQVLERFGVTVIDAEKSPFDPQVHEAIRQVPSEEHEPGTVIEVFQRGYQLKDRLLRPALVAVAGPGDEETD